MRWNDWMDGFTQDEQAEVCRLCFGSRDAGQVLSFFIGRGGFWNVESVIIRRDDLAWSTRLGVGALDRALNELFERGCLVDTAAERRVRLAAGVLSIKVDFDAVSRATGVDIHERRKSGSVGRMGRHSGISTARGPRE